LSLLPLQLLHERKVFRSISVDANYKVLRASFAQKLEDNRAPIESVSVAEVASAAHPD
jgi:hypothetical protein